MMPQTLALQEPPLVLGGHSFIQQLGVDPRPGERDAAAIVEACLDQGITWFDTTYQPERIALGKALRQGNARERAVILAWNFFQDFDDSGEVGGPSYYRPESIDLLRHQLQVDVIDILVVHALNDPEENRRQEDLAISWRDRGWVQRLGVWHPGEEVRPEIYDLAIAPGNIADDGGGKRFPAYQARGWETLATSPFVRGWLLQRLAQESGRTIEEIADLLLRYSAFLPGVDRLIVSMRSPLWIEKNLSSWRRGPLSEDESADLRTLLSHSGQ